TVQVIAEPDTVGVPVAGFVIIHKLTIYRGAGVAGSRTLRQHHIVELHGVALLNFNLHLASAYHALEDFLTQTFLIGRLANHATIKLIRKAGNRPNRINSDTQGALYRRSARQAVHARLL